MGDAERAKSELRFRSEQYALLEGRVQDAQRQVGGRCSAGRWCGCWQQDWQLAGACVLVWSRHVLPVHVCDDMHAMQAAAACMPYVGCQLTEAQIRGAALALSSACCLQAGDLMRDNVRLGSSAAHCEARLREAEAQMAAALEQVGPQAAERCSWHQCQLACCLH